MRETKLAALIDPDPIKRPSDYTVDLFLTHADYIFVGGSPSETMKDVPGATSECINHIRARREATKTYKPIWLFPGGPAQNVPGADGFLYLYVPNAKDPFYGWGVQVQSIDEVMKNYSPDQILETMYPIMGGEAGGVADVEEWYEDDLMRAATIANRLDFKFYYLESGSGEEILDIDIIRSVGGALTRPKYIYGGGISKREHIGHLFGIVDIMNMGTKLEKEPDFIVEARNVVEELKSIAKSK